MAHVLYLDDDQAQVVLISRWLQALGHSVSGFTVPAEALAAFEADPRRFDLVLTDMSMLAMSGLEFAQRIWEIEPGAAVIIATGCEDPNWADFARASGVRAVIEKPTTVEEMAHALQTLSPSSFPRGRRNAK